MAPEETSFDNPTFTSEERITPNKDKGPTTSKENEATTSEKQPTALYSTDVESRVSAPGPMRKTLHVLWKRRGLIFAVIAALFYSFKCMLIDYLTLTVDPFQAVIMIMPIMLLGSISILLVKRIPPPNTIAQCLWLFYGGCAMSAYLCSFSFSLTFLVVADAVTILYASLMFVGLLSWIILKEKLLLLDFVFAVISFAGVICISRPHFIFRNTVDEAAKEEAQDLFLGVIFALGAAFCIALSYPIIRKQSQLGVHTFTTVFCSAVVGGLTNALLCTVLDRWHMPVLKEWLFAIGAGVSYFVAQSTLFYALSIETATLVNIAMTVEIVFTFLWQFLLLEVTPFWTSYLGASLVILACVGIALKKRDTDSER